MAESEQKVTQQTQTFKYPEWAKMPEGYDFSTKGTLLSTRNGLEQVRK
jgi:hypothetical protein